MTFFGLVICVIFLERVDYSERLKITHTHTPRGPRSTHAPALVDVGHDVGRARRPRGLQLQHTARARARAGAARWAARRARLKPYRPRREGREARRLGLRWSRYTVIYSNIQSIDAHFLSQIAEDRLHKAVLYIS